MSAASGAPKTVFGAFLFTDLVGSTELKQRLGDAVVAEAIGRHDELFRRCLSEFGGKEHADTGDGFLASFDVPSGAVRCALAFQRRLSELDTPKPLRVRIGIHAGEIVLLDSTQVVEEERKLVGLVIDAAARVMSLARGGQILMTRGAFDSARQQLHEAPDGSDLQWLAHGPYVFKGLDDALEVFEVGMEGLSPLAPPQRSEKASPAARAAAASGLEGLAWESFIGRGEELDTLKRGVDAALSRQGRFIMIVGQPGIGKTRLAAEAGVYAQLRGARVLWGRCRDTEARLPYLPFVEVLRCYARDRGTEDLKRELGRGAADIVRLVPEIRERVGEIPELPGADPETERYRLFDHVCSCLVNVSHSQPLVVILEDLHSADEPSLMLLQHLARQVVDARLLVIGTSREEGLNRAHRLSTILAELRRERLYDRIRLDGLPFEEVAALLEAIAGHELDARGREFARGLERKSEGNPYFIEEILRHLAESGMMRREESLWIGDEVSIEEMGIPEGVKELIGTRLSRLSEPCNQMLRHAAVVGREFELDVLENMVGEDAGDLIASLEEAQRALVIDEGSTTAPETYLFTHALIRETLYEELSILRKRRLHAQAAEAIEAVHAHGLQPHIASLAVHYRNCSGSERIDKAIDYSIRAGEAARSLYAWDECIEHWLSASRLMEGHAYDLERRAGLLERLAIVALEGGLDYDRGFECLENALELYEASGDDQRVARIHGRLGAYLVIHEARRGIRRRTDIAHAWEHLRAAEAILSREPESIALGFVYQGMAVACWAEIQTEQGLSHARRALEIADRLGQESLWVFAAAALGGMHLFASGKLSEALAMLEQAREVAERLNLSYGAYLAAQFRGRCSCWLLDPCDAQSWWANELQSPRYSFPGSERRARLLNCLADAYWMSGKLGEGARPETEPDEESHLAEPGDRPISRPSAIEEERTGIHDADSIYYEPRIALWRGDRKHNERVATQRREEERRRGWRNLEGGYTAALARLRWGRGDLLQAETLLNEVISMVAEAPHLPTEIRERSQLALLYADLERAGDARPHLERCREILDSGENWRGLEGRVLLAEAVAGAAAGDFGQAESTFEQAIDVFRRYTLPWDEAEAFQRWGCALRGLDKRAPANDKFDAALAIYGRIGADSIWIETVEADKRAT